jgi:hypothetical protein
MFSRFMVLSLAPLVASFPACSASDDGGGGPEGASRDPSSNSPGGSSGSNGSNGAGDDGPPSCGPVTCGGPEIEVSGITPLPSCCADEAEGVCGTVRNGACHPPPEVDWTCPSATVEGMGEMMGCCIEGACGVDATVVGLGCAALDDPDLLVIYPDSPIPRACESSWGGPGGGADGG